MTRGATLEEKLNSLDTLSDVIEAFGTEIKALGYTYFDIGSLDLARVHEGPGCVRYFLSNYLEGEYEDYLPRNWPISDPTFEPLLSGLGPIDYLTLLKSSKLTVARSLQLGLLSLWNISDAWILPYNSPDYMRFVTVYMRGKADHDRFMKTRDQAFLLGSLVVRRVETLLQPEDLPSESQGRDYAFTKEELACIGALLTGASNPAIATQLGMSTDTVKYHLKKVFKKLGVRSRTEAAAKAQGLGYAPMQEEGTIVVKTRP